MTFPVNLVKQARKRNSYNTGACREYFMTALASKLTAGIKYVSFPPFMHIYA